MNYKIPPWKHQKAAIERAKDQNDFALFFSMGTGKTSTTINILRHKYNEQKKIFNTLILSPIITLQNWKREWLAHSQMDGRKIILLMGSGRKRCNLLAKAREEYPNGFIAITNYESLLMGELFEALQAWKPEVLVCDESHKCKEPRSKRAMKCFELAKNARYRYILTGTPVLKNPMDLFAQFKILDLGETFGLNFWSFRATYFYDKNAGMPKQRYFPAWKIRPGMVEELGKKIAQKSMRVTKEECLDLPPLVRQRIDVEMSPDQNRMYQEMKKDFVTFLKSDVCTASLAITRALRLQQIVSGYISTPDGKQIALTRTPRQEALKELLEEITPEHKVLIWCVFKQNYQQVREVCDELGVSYVECHGDTSIKKKFENVDLFNGDPNVLVFLGHPASLGIGINLVSASYAIFYSRTFSLEQDLQAESRNHRGGSEIHEKITRIDLVTPNTIDELVLKALSDKQQISEQLLKQVQDQI